MKYLKTFEKKSKWKYNVGDYVILDLEKVRRNNKKFNWVAEPIDTTALITDTTSESSLEKTYYNYEIIFYNGIDNKFHIISDSDIERLATPEEIEIFKLKPITNKYGL